MVKQVPALAALTRESPSHIFKCMFNMMEFNCEEWDVDQTVQFVMHGGYKRVALQLPDHLLGPAPQLVAALQSKLGPDVKIAVLADTAFNPEAVDEIAAQHMMADCVVHYGHASLAVSPNVPVHHVFPRLPLNLHAVCSSLAEQLAKRKTANSNGSTAVLLLDQSLLHSGEAVTSHLNVEGWHIVLAAPSLTAASNSGTSQVTTDADNTTSQPPSASNHVQVPTPQQSQQVDEPSLSSNQGSSTGPITVAGYSWDTTNDSDAQPPVYCWVGPTDTPSILALQLAIGSGDWIRMCPHTGAVEEGLTPGTAALAKRRYFLVEKARNAAILGILVSTLASNGLTTAMSHLRALIRAAGKKSYTVLVGKPNPAKLANFPEVEVWIQLSDPLGSLFDSRPFLSPLITPHEAVLALTGGMMMPGQAMQLGLAPLLASGQQKASQIAAAKQAFSGASGTHEAGSDDGEMPVAVTAMGGLSLQLVQNNSSNKQVMVQPTHGAQYLALRTWQGVEAPVAGGDMKEAAPAVEGLSGRAAGYTQEQE